MSCSNSAHACCRTVRSCTEAHRNGEYAGAVRRLDDDLLARFGERYAALLGNDHRREALLGRLAKLTALPGVDAHDPVI